MQRDAIPGPSQSTNATADQRDTARHNARAGLLRLLAAMLCGALLLIVAYQVPTTHVVDIGGYDAAYTQGFYDPERADAPGDRPYLVGADGSARWTRDVSYLLFPQAGLPAQITLRLRGWRAAGPPPNVTVLLNGTRELGRFQTSGAWEEHTFAITGGLWKPSDVVIELRADTAPLSADDPRPVGVLLNRATYRVGPPPITPYPPQLAYGALAAGMLWLLLGDRETRRQGDTETKHSSLRFSASPLLRFCVAWFLVLGSWLFLYRRQPLYPHPLRGLLPTLDVVMTALLAWRYGPRLAARAPALLDALAGGGILVWTGAVLWTAQQHVTLSVPGVEKDFRVFATRSSSLGSLFGTDGQNTVLRADGFYNLGYPFLLWLVRPLVGDNPFLAAQIIAALSGALLLGATWWLARRLLGRGAALLALLVLALSPLVVQYALYIGTDMPFAALCTLALACLFTIYDLRFTIYESHNTHPLTRSPAHPLIVILSGLTAGAAFLIRHPGILLLPFGWLVIWSLEFKVKSDELHKQATSSQFTIRNSQFAIRNLLIFTFAFLIAILPQLIVNVTETGQPLYNQQAKNIWLAVFGNGDWGRWAETANNVTLGQVVAQDPGRFLTNWWNNVRGFLGTGGEDTSEFGRAFQLRLLGFPANWLALAGLLGWLATALVLRFRQSSPAGDTQDHDHRVQYVLLLAWVALYVVTVSVGLSLPRFFLPLAPVYALAAAWTVSMLGERLGARRAWLSPLALGLLLALLLWGGFGTGARYMLDNQPADEVAAVRLVQNTLQPGERVAMRLPPEVALDKYSAIAQRVAPEGAAAPYLLQMADAPPPAGASVVGEAGRFTLYRLAR